MKSSLLAHRLRRLALPALALGWFLIGWFARGILPLGGGAGMALPAQAWAVLARQSFGQLPPSGELAHAAVRAMVNSIGDRYAVYFEPAVARHESLAMAGNDGAVGLHGAMRGGQFVVGAVTPGGPAAAAGLQAGDVILAIDGWRVRPDATVQEVVVMLRGQASTSSRIEVQRDGQALVFDVSRQTLPEVTARLLDGGLAYLRFDRFTAETPRQVKTALAALLASNPRGLILDVRYNGGGLMDATRAVLDEFLPAGVAFYARLKDGRLIPYQTQSGEQAENIPMVVLIGPETYSAPETMAISLSELGRAVLVGSTTHGKGMITATVRLRDESAIHFSVAQSVSPVRQNCFDGEGVPPQVPVQQDPSGQEDVVLRAGIDYLLTQGR